MLEAKLTNDGGTARDKAGRFGSLRRECQRLGGLPLFALVDGLGWARTTDALGPVIRDCDGRVFTRATMTDMFDVEPFPTLAGQADRGRPSARWRSRRLTLDTERVSGFADALQAIEDEIRRLLEDGEPGHRPGLEGALATVQATRADVSSYYEYLVNLHEEQLAGWGDWAVPETECVPCLAETAPHTCIGPS